MPQDSLRSVVYRSFVTCDGSKGVAECKTIRKYKKIKNASTSRDGERKEKPSPEELQNLSCFQMMEVSRGADRLNQVIDSLSNRPSSFDRPSNHIATDLLRGALHLQESLVMLGKLQEASKYISKKQKEKKDFQKPRMSADLAPRDCYDELREAIRESFARQNLLPKERTQDHDKASISSKSSSSIRNEKMHKGSNLIAKLMGLEEVPSIKQTERGRFLDIDLPRPNKKPEFMVQKVVRQRLSLEEIIETMQFKGILRTKSVDVDGSNASKFHPDESFAVDGPPIVIMRPLRRDGDQINEQEQVKSRQILIPKKTRRESKQPSENSKLKQKINKGKVGNSSGRVGVKPAKRSLDSQDKLSIAKTNNSKPPVPQMRKKAAVKVAPDTTKPPETKDAKPQMSDKTQDLTKLTTLKHSRNMRENNVSKSQRARRQDKSMKPASLNPTAPKKNPRKTEANRKPSSSSVESILSGGDFAINNIEELVKKVEPDLYTKEVAKASPMAVTENYGDEATSPNDDLNRIEDGILIPSLDQDHLKGRKTKTNKRELLLSNASFLNYIEELFDIKTHASIVFQTASLVEGEVLHDPLLLDCAKEILQRKSTMMRNHWSQHLFRKAKCHLSTEQFVEEICDAIEGLHNYSKPCGEGVLADSIYPMLERDIRRNEEVTGGWDSGWRKGYTTEAVDKVMHDVEELVLSEIVGDVIIEIIE